MPAYARYSLADFAVADPAAVLGRLADRYATDGYADQSTSATTAWEEQIAHLRTTAADLIARRPDAAGWHLLLEYPMPRRAKRIDAVLLAADLVFVLEYKTGGRAVGAADRRQVEDYALDLRDFHAETRGRAVGPVLVTPNRNTPQVIPPRVPDDPVQAVHVTGDGNTDEFLAAVFDAYHDPAAAPIDPAAWDASPYRPTPTIIEAARHLYATHRVRDLARSEAGAADLDRTTAAVRRVIEAARAARRKTICFVTGVPGAGKTLAGLNVVHAADLAGDRETPGVFLSGNGPLVKVLTEALARDRAGRDRGQRGAARRTVGTFVQNVHGFLREHAAGPAPPDRVVVFDEAQRAWDREHSLRKAKRPRSEPELMLEIMDRHDWAVVVALLGSGQEINTGEAGLPEWGRALRDRFAHWTAHIAPGQLDAAAVGRFDPLFPEGPGRVEVIPDPALHLSVSRRSFRAEAVSGWVEEVLAGEAAAARRRLAGMTKYPIVLTRDLEAARRWLRGRARGLRRAGLVASSGARRLRPYGLDVKADSEPAEWFLNPPEDVRSSPFLELAATEFAVQGLELDWAGVCWDADFRRRPGGWEYKKFAGTRWTDRRNEADRRYTLNKYRVLLTRAREGMVIWVPPGSDEDETRRPAFYHGTTEYLLACGAELIAPGG